MNRRQFVGLGLLSLPGLALAAPLLRQSGAALQSRPSTPVPGPDDGAAFWNRSGWLSGAPKPVLSFGVVTDVHWADEPTRGRRDYLASANKLRQCVDFWNTQGLEFVIECGDFVDRGDLGTIQRINAVYRRAAAPTRCVLGNHDFVAFPRTKVIRALGMPAAYYSYGAKGWRFIVLDGLNLSEIGWQKDSPQWQAGHAVRERLIAEKAPDAFHWNGGVGPEQRSWLAKELAAATAKREKVVVFCHIPTLPGTCRRGWLLWDHAEVVKVLDTCPTLVAYMCGHDHLGGYGVRNGVHYVTYPAMVEGTAASRSFVVDAYDDRLVVRNMMGQYRVLEMPAQATSAV